jgi:hypothetical protein
MDNQPTNQDLVQITNFPIAGSITHTSRPEFEPLKCHTLMKEQRSGLNAKVKPSQRVCSQKNI